MKNISLKNLLVVISLILSSSSGFAENYMVFNNQKLQLNKSLHYFLKKLGNYDNESFKNGVETKTWELNKSTSLDIDFIDNQATSIFMYGKGSKNYLGAVVD